MKELLALRKNQKFDPEWYSATYNDVSTLKMDPGEHYLKYGHLMNRDPGPDFSTVFTRLAYSMKPEHEPLARLEWMQRKYGNSEANSKRVLMAAHEVARRGNRARAITLAEAHLPKELAYTVDVLRANCAIVKSDMTSWQKSFNDYLSHFDVSPIKLEGEGSVFDRLTSGPLPELTGGPLISVIMPAWNSEKTVRKAANSILGQTWRNLELLIVDDCSDDSTWKVLQEIAAVDSRVKIMRNKANVGPYVSKNFALAVAKGEWITGHDADDWAHPQRLETHLAEAIPASCEASLTYMVRMQASGMVDHFTTIGDFSCDGVARVSSISTLFNANWMRSNLGHWDAVRYSADSEMISRAKVILGDNFKKLDTIGMVCLDAPSSLTNDPLTGIRTATGLSPIRKAYKDAWVSVHKSIGSNECFIEFPQANHRYQGDFEHFVPSEVIEAATPSQ